MKDNINILKNDIPIDNRTLWNNDNLELLRLMKDECIDLIYLDPPFNSGTNYSVGDKGFIDSWKNSELSKFAWFDLKEKDNRLYNFLEMVETIHGNSMRYYLIFMSVRLIEMHRVLKPTGRLALHCDDNASHYLKICLDLIFGKENFRNDVALLYKNGSKNAKTHFPRNKDNLLLYSKDIKNSRFYNTMEKPSKKTLRNIEIGFKITWNTQSGKWHETYYRPYETFSEEEIGELNKLREKKLKERPAEIHVRHALNGKEIKYLDWWDDMTIIPQSDRNINNPKNESVGWPTQKNVKIPKRIIETCTQIGEIVFDPFCGSGTTLEAAESMKRKWLGCDLSEDAINISFERIEKFMGMFSYPIYKKDIGIKKERK